MKSACAFNDVIVHRADELRTSGVAMEHLWRRLVNASFVIADISEPNPNVYYEIGLAHAIGVQSLLVSEEIYDLPFDIQHHRIIKFRNDETGLALLDTELRSAAREIIDQLENESHLIYPTQLSP
jgi:hypothetical protein